MLELLHESQLPFGGTLAADCSPAYMRFTGKSSIGSTPRRSLPLHASYLHACMRPCIDCQAWVPCTSSVCQVMADLFA